MQYKNLFDQIIWVGGGKNGQYFQELREELWKMTGSVFTYHKDEAKLWSEHIFADTNGWIICVEEPAVAERYLKLIENQRGNHWISLMTMGVNKEILKSVAKEKNIALYHDILLGQPIIEFVHDLTQGSMLFSSFDGNVRLLLGETQSKIEGEHTQSLLYMKRMAEHYGIKDITLRSDVSEEPEHTSYMFYMMGQNGEMLAHSSVTITSNELFIRDAIYCLHSIADKYPLTTNAVMGNSHRFPWFPSIMEV